MPNASCDAPDRIASSAAEELPWGMVGEPAARLPARLVLYDGVCVVCNKAVQELIKIDRAEQLRFAPLQGATAAAILQRHPEIPADLDSIVYVEASNGQEQVSWYSEAILRIDADLGLQSRLAWWAGRLPRWCADLAYRLFAGSRYRIFGKFNACPLPPPEVRRRFLP